MAHISRNSRTATTVAAAIALLITFGATAHTTVRSQATEGVTADNALRIGHGCTAPGGEPIPVIAQSTVFPTVNPVLTSSDGSAVGGLDAVIAEGTLAARVRGLQDRSVFASQETKRDALGNAVGWSAFDGVLDTMLAGRSPFQFAGPNFVASSCAKRLLVKVAIADICSRAPADTVASGKVNLWIPDNGSQYATLGKAQGIDGIGEPATLIVNRNLAANPLPPVCGDGVDVTVTPSAVDVDANLGIPGVWGLPTAQAQSVPLIEYYHAGFDHYFMTWVPDEIAALDDGSVLMGWERTGRKMRAYASAQTGTSPVCRFYIPPGYGDSHFYGRGTVECAATGQQNPAFVLESAEFMQMFLPVAGVCPAGTTPIFRVFNRRPDVNHRNLTDKLTREQMVSEGWLAEGDGPDVVVMCAPR